MVIICGHEFLSVDKSLMHNSVLTQKHLLSEWRSK